MGNSEPDHGSQSYSTVRSEEAKVFILQLLSVIGGEQLPGKEKHQFLCVSGLLHG